MKDYKKVLLGKLSMLLYLVVVCFFIGCASTGGSADISPGSLTITGIPTEYEGKFIMVANDYLYMPKAEGQLRAKELEIIPSAEKPKDRSKAARTGASVRDGEAAISIYTEKLTVNPFGDPIGSYVGSDTVVDVGICIVDTATPDRTLRSSDADVRFESITFEDGKASLVWADAIKSGSITITDIPAEYKDMEITVRIGYTAPGLGGAAVSAVGGLLNLALGGTGVSNVPTGSYETDGNSYVRRSTVTVKFFGTEKEPSDPDKKIQTVKSHKVSFTETGAKDVMVSILTESSTSSSGVVTNNFDNFLFKAVQFTDGNGSVNFKSGVKQK